MSETDPTPLGCTIAVEQLFKEVNAQRKMLNQPPMEYSAMASRCSIRFQIEYKKELDFTQEKIVISAQELPLLEGLLDRQFGIYFDGQLTKLCEKRPKKTPTRQPAQRPPTDLPTPPAQPESAEAPGLMSRIKGLFSGDSGSSN